MSNGPQESLPRDGEAIPDLLMPGMLELLSERDLCMVWSRCHEVQTTRENHRDDQLERLRDECLAKLEERNPTAMAAWLSRAQQTAGELRRLLEPDPRRTSSGARS